MREKEIEQKFTLMVKQAGGMALKFVSPGMSGMPDRIVLLPGGYMAFVEVKSPGKAPRPLQEPDTGCCETGLRSSYWTTPVRWRDS